MKKSEGLQAIEKVALQKGISVAEVCKEIELAIDIGMASIDPSIRAFWANIPREGKKLTPEEVVIYMAETL